MSFRTTITATLSALLLACGGGSVSGPLDVPTGDVPPGDVQVPDWEVLAESLCLPCESDDDCSSGLCVGIGGDPRCTYPCPDSAACPAGFLCVVLYEAGENVCYPRSADCSCTWANDGETRDCDFTNEFGTCSGQSTCDHRSGWSCDAAAAEKEQCDYQDNDCDGEVDEDFLVGGYLVDGQNCSLCGFSCLDFFDNGTGHCTTAGTGLPHCELAFCDPGYQPWEEGCAPVAVLPLCTPCTGTDDCDGGDCVLLEGEGGVCTWSCLEKPCPEDYECTDMGDDSYCLPPTGSCECTPENLGLTRPCANENVHGICHGQETCTVDGFSGCSAPVPLPEDCNGQDDDCNGQVDDGMVAPECSVGACVGEMECQGIEGWICVVPPPEPEVCDYLDNDCDGLVDNGFVDPATGLYVTDGNCGGCGNDCLKMVYPHAYGSCIVTDGVAGCVLVCEAGFVDLNGVESDGCECVYLGPDDPPNGVDENCDGIDGEPDNAVFVASWGSDQNPGTVDKPLRSIGKGLDAAVVKSLGHVYVSAGTYTGAVTLADGKGVYGGFDEDFSVHDPEVFESIIQRKGCTGDTPGTVNAICQSGGFEATFSGFLVEGPVCADGNQSSYGLYVRGCASGLELTRNTIVGGQGGPGDDGEDGDKGDDGLAGGDGEAATDVGVPYCYPSFPTQGGQGGVFQCGDKVVNGGSGGDGSCPDFDQQYDPDVCPTEGIQTPGPEEFGQDGVPAPLGGKGGAPGNDALITTYFYDWYTGQCTYPQWACSACQLSGYDSYGDKGADGQSGPAGSGGSGCAQGLGTVSDGLWTGHSGLQGTKAGSGGGGGGGGAGGGVETASGCTDQAMLGLGFSDYGGSGGGGGSGACGGLPGTGGQPGGGSFAVFLVWDQAPGGLPLLQDNRIVTGIGGPGGSGGAGGLGGVGGHGGSGGEPGSDATTWCARGGRDGGNGGNGGHGGGGGGGCGGPSVGLYLHGGGGLIPPDWGESANEFLLSGAGGQGGAGGTLPVPDGPQGAPGKDGPHLTVNY